jgi:hypothetical protein
VLVIELVVYVRSGKKVTEMCCGWCELPVEELSKGMTHKLPIHGGSPSAEVEISDKDLRTNRTGLKYMQKIFTSGVEKRLEIEVKKFTSLNSDVRQHLELMPSTCLVHSHFLYFVSGFMNYKSRHLLKSTIQSSFKQPDGDVVISTFPRVYDSPDILEELALVWVEDFKKQVESKVNDVDFIMTRTKEIVCRLYPIFHSDEFRELSTSSTSSAAGDVGLIEKRKKLIQSALRFGAIH